MKRAVIGLLLAVNCLAAGDAQLLQTREQVWRAWFAGDLETVKQLVPPNAIAISAGESEWKHQPQIIAESADFHAHGGRLLRLEFPQTEIQHFGNTAILYSTYRLEIEQGGKRSAESGRVSEIFVYEHGRWTNPGWHTDHQEK